MAALLFLVALGLIDFRRLREIVRIGHGEMLVLAVTFLATLLLQLEFAILVGVLCSLLMYLKRTTHPAIHVVAPNPASALRRFEPVGDTGRPECPQLALLRVDGFKFRESLLFITQQGVNHGGPVDHRISRPTQMFKLAYYLPGFTATMADGTHVATPPWAQ